MQNHQSDWYGFKAPLIRLAIVILLFFTLFALHSADATELTGRDIMVMVDEAPDGDDKKSIVEMILINHRGRKRVRTMVSFSKDYGRDTKKLMAFKKPLDVKGTSFLSWEYDNPEKDDDKWLYMPALRKVRRISGESDNDAFMGSDFTYDDMGDRNVDEDTHTLIGEATVSGHDCWKIQSVPVEKNSAYDRRTLWVRKDALITVKAEYFDAQGLIKTFIVEELRPHQDFWTIFKMKMENHRENHATIMNVSDVDYNTGVSDRFFSVNTISRGHLK
ncbi:MAG: outer membrane lipoprotein-sorting protein [Desulfobacterales bacterium]|nr:outer membrane lipoprotein-sorting protein [Desulfobacterales bacterium]